MRFKQLQDLLEYVVKGREHLSQLYSRLEHSVDIERSKMLLSYLAKKEWEQRDSLLAYLEGAPEGVRDTWFENAYDSDVLGAIDRTQLGAKATPDVILGVALDLDTQLISLLEKNVAVAPSQAVTSAMKNLISHEEEFQRRLTLSVERLEDI